jgi:hypothetical protein
MIKNSHSQTNLSKISAFLSIHKVSLGVLLAGYGFFYLTSVILSMWTLSDWGKDTTAYPPSTITTLLPRSFINPLFFVTSFPALIIGAIMLCNYSLREITPNASADKQYVAILLTAFGFTYQVIGAWPLGNVVVFPWQWQKQILTNGPVFAWTLYLLSILVLCVGVISLYEHSLIYHQKHGNEEEKVGEPVA